jgi:hypothetical protein
MIGLRPNLSLKLPTNGANRNWVIAYANVNHPPYLAASLISLWINSLINFGITGMIIPQPVISINMVMKMNPMAADFLLDVIVVLLGKANKQKNPKLLKKLKVLVFSQNVFQNCFFLEQNCCSFGFNFSIYKTIFCCSESWRKWDFKIIQ